MDKKGRWKREEKEQEGERQGNGEEGRVREVKGNQRKGKGISMHGPPLLHRQIEHRI
jgi:hypothetical protein